MENKIHLHYIAYSSETLKDLPHDAELLNNLGNERPDWFEYWPMRQFLLSRNLQEDSFYGFFSPKFSQKTLLTFTEAKNIVAQHYETKDVILFSPQPDMGAFFLNVFEQNETFDPGFIDTCEAFFRHFGSEIPLRQLVMDSRTTVFSNYFVARPAFWREWLYWTEIIFAVCETGYPDSLQKQLTYATTYPGAVQRKVFFVERIASLLLTLQPHWRVHAANPFSMAWSASTKFRDYPTECYIHDALKIAFNDLQHSQYIEAFTNIRNKIFHKIN